MRAILGRMRLAGLKPGPNSPVPADIQTETLPLRRPIERTGYIIANYTINDPETYKKYVEAVMPVIAKYEGKLIIGDFEMKKLEGSPNQGAVVVEFDSAESAERFYYSQEYTEGKKFRIASIEGWVAIAKKKLRRQRNKEICCYRKSQLFGREPCPPLYNVPQNGGADVGARVGVSGPHFLYR